MKAPLALHGVASDVRGYQSEQSWQVLRLRIADNGPAAQGDAAIVRNQQDLAAARGAGFAKIVVISANGVPYAEEEPWDNILRLPSAYEYLSDGDVLGFQRASRRFRTLYRHSSKHNSFLITERCNHYCLMCSQPPRDVEDDWLLDEIKSAISLVDKGTESFAFTGGEPLLNWQGFIDLLAHCRDSLPRTAIHVLTNGRVFANSEVSAWAEVKHPRLMAGIPIYSAVDVVHDYVVQAKGAFDETVLGVLKLKDKGQRVEVRVVLHAITVRRLIETCRWLARNLPFVDHVALMGVENTGFALANGDLLWNDPVDYQNDLATGVDILSSAGLKTSVYNLPRCPREKRLAFCNPINIRLEKRLSQGMQSVHRTSTM